MEINLEGVWLGCKAGIPAMLASGGGAIVNVASFVALMGAATAQIAYTASKGGVLSMTREIAVEYARQGIRANALCPGPIETPLLEELLSDPGAPRPAHGAHPDGPARARRGAREGRAVPRVRRRVVHDRRRARGRRRHHRRVRHARVALSYDAPMTTVPGMLTAAELHEEIANGAIDTVLVAFPDLQGRLVGKRVTGHYWAEQMQGGREPVHACNYLLAVDVDMNPLSGYQFANWEQGYGDVAVQPDLATIRRIPWLDATALVVCDVVDEETGEPVEVSPRRILQRQVERARPTLGYTAACSRRELEFFLFRESVDEAAAKGYANLTPHSQVIEDYHILQTTRDEYVIRAIRNGMDGAGVPDRVLEGRSGPRPARDQPRVRDRGRDGRPPRDLQERRQGDRGAARPRRSRSWRSTPSDEVGSSCHVHSSLWDTDRQACR